MQQVALFVCFLFFAAVLGQTADPCNQFSASCAKCHMAGLGCRYVWTREGLYNSAVNASCISSALFTNLTYHNQYTKTVFGYALNEEEIISVAGQYKLSKPGSSHNYLAHAVPCYDRHLCYCRPMPPPPPSTLVVRVTNCLTGAPLSDVSINLNGNQSRTTNSGGSVTYSPIAVGAYTVFASLTGYTSNTTNTPSIGTNETHEVSTCLEPLPCTLVVQTVLDSDGSALSGVSVSLDNAQVADQITPASGSVTFPLAENVVATTVSGAISGYSSVSSPFTCPRGGVANVTLRFIPIPATVIVQVLDERTFLPITSALTTLSVTNFNESGVDPVEAKRTFYPVDSGTYTAAASAVGYSSGTNTTGLVLRNTTVLVIIYLRELPCNVTVTVLNNDTGAPLDAARVSLNLAGSNQTTGPDGRVQYSFRYDLASNATASKTGFSTEWDDFVCTRGANVDVILRLTEVKFIIIAAVDASSTGFPLLEVVNIYLNGTKLLDSQKDPLDSRFYIVIVPGFPIAFEITADAVGFNPKGSSSPVTFSEAGRRAYNISLAPQEFNLYFIPGETVNNGAGFLAVRKDGVIPNNYAQFETLDATIGFAPGKHDIKTGGSATQNVQPEINQPYSTLTWVTGGVTYESFAAVYSAQVPTTQYQFELKAKNLDTLVWNNAFNASRDIFVPNFASTPERNLIFEVHYKLNAAYFNIRVSPINVAQTQSLPFGTADFIWSRVYLRNNQFRYSNLDAPDIANRVRGLFEVSIVFGEQITKIEIGFPLETYNTSASNWLDDTVEGGIKPFLPNQAPSTYLSFLWPPSDLEADLFTRDTTTGVFSRNTNARLFLLRDFVVVRLPAGKKKNE